MIVSLKQRNVVYGLILLACGASFGCSDSDPVQESGELRGQDDRNGEDKEDDADTNNGNDESSEQSFYALANEIYAADGSTTYVNVISSLDIEGDLDYSEGIEYTGGRATIATRGGYVFVAGPENPVIERFAVTLAGKLAKEDEISFANYGIEHLALDEWGNTFISDTKAYLFNSSDGTTIIWNPKTMKIEGEVDNRDFELVRPLGDINGSAAVVQGNRLFRTVFWSDWDAWKTSEEQYLAVYDTDSDELIDFVPESRCPGLGNRVDRDEEGNLYFSNWIWNVPETLLSDAPKSCALRIRAGEERFDEDWILPYADLTGGREAAMYAYLGEGKGLLSVFHDERIEYDASTVPNELASTDNWRVWHMDFEKGEGEPLSGLTWMAGAASTYHIDGRSFILVPSADWSRVEVNEIVDGEASLKFGIDGWTYLFFKVR